MKYQMAYHKSGKTLHIVLGTLGMLCGREKGATYVSGLTDSKIKGRPVCGKCQNRFQDFT